jgi:hypothetical protein
LTLLLIFLHRQLTDPEQKGQIADLIFSQQFGTRSFNLDNPERTACMDSLYRTEDFADPDRSIGIGSEYPRPLRLY